LVKERVSDLGGGDNIGSGDNIGDNSDRD